jgi:hypothetical protein
MLQGTNFSQSCLGCDRRDHHDFPIKTIVFHSKVQLAQVATIGFGTKLLLFT